MLIWQIGIDGKNQGLISLLIAISLYAIARKEIVSGFSYGLSLVFVKILPIMFLPSLSFGARKRMLWLLSALLLPVIVYAAFGLHRIDITAPLRLEGNFTTPQNLPYLFTELTGINISSRIIGLFGPVAAGCAVLFGVAAQMRATMQSDRLWKLSLSMLLVLITLLVFNRKSDSSYLGMCFFLFAALTVTHAADKNRTVVAAYTILSLIALPAGAFWFFIGFPDAPILHARLAAGDRDALLIVALHTLLVSSYSVLGYHVFRDLRKTLPERAADSIISIN